MTRFKALQSNIDEYLFIITESIEEIKQHVSSNIKTSDNPDGFFTGNEELYLRFLEFRQHGF